MFIERRLTAKLTQLASQLPAVFLTGPRQSGKSTLLHRAFPDHAYANLEEPDLRQFAAEDPRGFLARLGTPAIIDEAQRVPDLFSYLQIAIDQKDRPGSYLLSGSQNFLLMRSISQSLAGRVGLLTLLPLSLPELFQSQLVPDTADSWMIQGGYPRLMAGGIDPADYFPSYVATYLERDIRAETGVRDLTRFTTFLRMVAGRIGSPINLADVGRQVSADARTVAAWLAILEQSSVVFRLPSWHANWDKRLVKTAKLYFSDTGLVCSLLGLDSVGQLQASDLRGRIFENAIVADIAKTFFNQGRTPPLSFVTSLNPGQTEIDLVIESGRDLHLIEVKAAQTANSRHVQAVAGFAPPGYTVRSRQVVYDGPDGLTLSGVQFTNWRALAQQSVPVERGAG